MKKLERFFWITIVIFLLLVLSIEKTKAISVEAERYLQVFHEVISVVESDYVDEAKETSLYVGAIKGALSALDDPHTRFLDQDEFRDHKDETKGSFGGIGVEVTYKDGVIWVVSPIDGTPAMRSGIAPKDRIVEINGVPTKKLGITEAIKVMRGPVGSTINLGILKDKSQKPIRISLKRELIKIQYIKSAIIKEHNIGYIRLSQFMGMEETSKEFKSRILKFMQKNVSGIIVDLRMNPGGLLTMATDLSDLFLPENKDIVSIRGRGGNLVNVFKTTKKEQSAENIPLVVLIDEGSASASEIFAGAMKDHKRAVILGKKSFGKGSVQNIYNLPNHTGMALTIQRYYTPSGESIHGKGITPDKSVNAFRFSESEVVVLEKLHNDKLLEAFTSKNKEGYSKEAIQKFKKFLKKKNLELSDRSAGFLLKREYATQKKANIYDLEYDPQLIEAIKELKKR
jgi:carboxyl-terminal processing protease